MKIYVPFTDLTNYVPNSIGVEMLDEFAYSRYFIERWAEGEPFINVEHDVQPSPEQIQELIDCPEPWCYFSYEANDDQSPFFGCAKFTPAVLPNVWVERPWGNCDVFFADKMRELGIHAHKHASVIPHRTELVETNTP